MSEAPIEVDEATQVFIGATGRMPDEIDKGAQIIAALISLLERPQLYNAVGDALVWLLRNARDDVPLRASVRDMMEIERAKPTAADRPLFTPSPGTERCCGTCFYWSDCCTWGADLPFWAVIRDTGVLAQENTGDDCQVWQFAGYDKRAASDAA